MLGGSVERHSLNLKATDQAAIYMVAPHLICLIFVRV